MRSVDILCQKEYSYAYEEGRIILTKNGVAYTYGDGVWKDKLTAVGAETISYDAQGNPISYLGHTLTWEKGRQLKSFDGNTYTYNANGIRTSKTVNGVKHTYTLDGSKILRETWGNNVLVPLYDNEDSVCGILYNGTPYYFEKNLQGDVTGIYTRSGANMVLYTYDAWGVCTIVSDSSDCGIGSINPFRYRGYYYDAEIGMYYLQSRYYDPVTGRFINADEAEVALYVRDNVVGFDLFAYCCNDVVNSIDPIGYWHLDIRADALVLSIDLLIYLVPLIPPVNKMLSKFKYLPKYAVKSAITTIKKFLLKVLPKVNIGLAVVGQLLDWISDLTGLFPFGASIGGLIVWALSKIFKTWTKNEKAFGWFGKVTSVTYIRIF